MEHSRAEGAGEGGGWIGGTNMEVRRPSFGFIIVYVGHRGAGSGGGGVCGIVAWGSRGRVGASGGGEDGGEGGRLGHGIPAGARGRSGGGEWKLSPGGEGGKAEVRAGG